MTVTSSVILLAGRFGALLTRLTTRSFHSCVLGSLGAKCNQTAKGGEMKEQWQEECAALRAELAALQQQLQVLGAKRASTRTLSRGRLSKGVLVVVLSVVALLAAGGVLYGQGALDALFIDKDGNVGIGTTIPGEKLHISGGKIQLDGNQQVKFTDTDLNNNLRLRLWSGHGLGVNAGTLFYAANSRHSWRDSDGANERMALTTGQDGGLSVLGTGTSSFTGNVGIGTTQPSAKLEVNLVNADGWKGNLKGLRLLAPDNNYYLDVSTYIVTSGNAGYHLSPKGNTGLVITTPGLIGIGTTDPQAKLHVDGGELRVRASHDKSDANIGQFIANNQTQGIGIGYNSIQALGSNTVPNQDIIIKPKGNGTVYLDGPVVIKKFGEHGVNQPYVQLVPYSNIYMAWQNGGTPQLSDERLKIDLRQIPNAVDKVRRLRGVTYHWNERGLQFLTGDIESSISAGPNATAEENEKLWQTERDKRYKALARTNVGIVAHDVETVLPEAVTTDEEGYKSVRYHYLIPLLIEALKEQDRTVKDQARVVTQQQQEIARLTVANLAVQQQVAELAALKEQVAQLAAAMRRIPVTHLSNASQESSR